MRHAKIDATGQRLRKGDVVRVIGVPDLSLMDKSGHTECEPVFAHLVGTYKRVDAFDAYGCAELNFLIRNGKHRARAAVRRRQPFLCSMLYFSHAETGR